ncbi:hypothetical protein HY382_02820 [Candidatus Curtissbacteria bacterium]|nr:hypothetical protein [Candidatus Curtissbacteria bacterium]
MKKYLIFPILLILSLGIIAPTFAQTIEKKENLVVEQNRTIEQDYFAWGEDVTISGTVNGDAYVGGGKVLVEGNIMGDLFVAGGSVQVRGRIDEDVRVAGGDVTISGDVGGNITALGGSIEISDSARINGSLTSAGGSINNFAEIGRGATIAGGDVTIGNKINGNFTSAVGNLTLTPKAEIMGNLNYLSDGEARIREGAKVSGKITHNLPQKPQKDVKSVARKANNGFRFVSFLVSLLVGFIILKFAPNITQRTQTYILKKPLSTLGIAILSLLATPFVIILFLVTIIGIPLAVLLILFVIIDLYLAKIFVALAVGTKILDMTKSVNNRFLALLTGLVIYLILGFIPLIGPIVMILTVILGFGAILRAKFESLKLAKSKNII